MNQISNTLIFSNLKYISNLLKVIKSDLLTIIDPHQR